jgi:hypothetical protein
MRLWNKLSLREEDSTPSTAKDEKPFRLVRHPPTISNRLQTGI